jgi:uncharacterized membrane protein YhhN
MAFRSAAAYDTDAMITIAIFCIVVSAGLCIRAHYADHAVQLYVFKPLTTVLVIVVAVLSGGPHSEYWSLVVVGLLLCLAGDVFLMLPGDKFLQGLLSFLGAHIVFTAAFVSVTRTVTPWLVAAIIIIAATLYAVLYPGLAKMKIPVLVYVLAISIMAWRAWEGWFQLPAAGTLMAAGSTVLFMVSDSTLAFDRFRGHFRAAQAVILSTYFASILLLALSTGS